MRISNRAIYRNINFHLSNLTEQLKNIQERIATERRINKPSDDPIGTTQALRLRKVLSQIDQYGKNIEGGSSWLKVTDTALDAIGQLVSRAKEIASLMSTGGTSESEREAAVRSVQGLLDQLVQIGNTKLNGRYIFSGYRDDTPAYTDDLTIRSSSADPGNNPAYTGQATSSGTYTGLYGKQYVVEITTGGAVGVARYRVSENGGETWGPADAFETSTSPTEVYNSTDLGVRIAFTDSGTLTPGDRFFIEVSRYQGDSEKIRIVTGASSRVEMNLTGTEVFGQAGSDLFDVLTELKNALETNDTAGVRACLSPLVQFQSNLTGYRGEVGNRLERMETYKKILSDFDLQHTNRLDEITGVDLSQLAVLLQLKQTLYESALYSASRILSLNSTDLLR
ncbi:MAG: flagellar hook-associated protein FlgL [Thermodesulfobacteriota bacterium]